MLLGCGTEKLSESPFQATKNISSETGRFVRMQDRVLERPEGRSQFT
jgi:hypothetical protein